MSTAPTATRPDTCNHVRPNGAVCNSLALTGQPYCYFHKQDRERTTRLSRSLDHKRSTLSKWATPDGLCQSPQMTVPFDDQSAALFHSLHLPLLEDIASIQVALTNVIRAIATQQIDRRAAGHILYALQIASSNLKHTRKLTPDHADCAIETDAGDELPPSEFDEAPTPPRIHQPLPSTQPSANMNESGLAQPPFTSRNCHPERAHSATRDNAVAVAPAVASAPAVAVEFAVAPVSSTTSAASAPQSAPSLLAEEPTTNNQETLAGVAQPPSAVSSTTSAASAPQSAPSLLAEEPTTKSQEPISAPPRLCGKNDLPVEERGFSPASRAPNKQGFSPGTRAAQLAASRALRKGAKNGKYLRELLQRIQKEQAAVKKSPQIQRSFDSATLRSG